MDTKDNVEVQPVSLKCEEYDKQTGAEARIELLSSKKRFKRALKRLGLVWGAAVLSVLIPILHFVLVPTLFLAGPVMAVLKYKEEYLCFLKGQCPHCGKDVSSEKPGQEISSSIPCPHCNSVITVIKDKN